VRNGAEELPLIRDEHRYVAHPHMVRLTSGAWLLVANCAPRRRFTLHPPQDPEYFNVLIFSTDEGRHWSSPHPVPAYGWTGTECAGLTALSNGAVLLNQWKFRWYTAAAAAALEEPQLRNSEAIRQSLLVSSELDAVGLSAEPAERSFPWARGGGNTITHRSLDGGRTWDDRSDVATQPYSGGYGMRGAVVLADGEIILPLSDVPHYEKIFLVRSTDNGFSWARPEPVASLAGYAFEEPAPLLLGDGTILMLLRENATRSLFSVRSTDSGRHWSTPQPTGIDSYPAHLIALPDSRIVAVCGSRRAPLGIFAFVSEDSGLSWLTDRPIAVRTDLPSKDLGYPTAILRSDGKLFVAYYYRDTLGVTGVWATTIDVGQPPDPND
jgi:BNR repeat-like domain